MAHNYTKYYTMALASILLILVLLSASAQSIGANKKNNTHDSYGACLYVDGKATGVRKGVAHQAIAVFVPQCASENDVATIGKKCLSQSFR